MSIWMWEEVDPSRSGAAGDLAKLFKNERVKQPAVFADGGISADATLMAREVLQNSWDAARELHREIIEDGGEPPEFGAVFEFVALEGDAKAQMVEALGLRELAARSRMSERRVLGLPETNALDHLDDATPLRLLKISESATTGMYGPFSGARSKLYLALVSIGVTMKDKGAGGSYGYGKAGLIRGSETRSVFAYTCFRERHDDPGITRRLLGMTYWGQHEDPTAAKSFTGFARFGDSTDGTVVPFVNDEADAKARELGIDLRDSVRIEDCGTTFLVVDPSVGPEELRIAVERNWWPAIEGDQFTVEIRDADGSVMVPRPRKDPVLATFIRARELATTAQDAKVANEFRTQFQAFEGRRLGSLGLVADLDDWSYPRVAPVDESEDEAPSIRHRSLVALMRGPGMVVEYFEAGQQPPFVRGVFVADDEVDDLLTRTEPKAHDSWEAAGGDDVDSDARKVAKTVLERVKRYVANFRKGLRPPTPRPEALRLPDLEALFRGVFSNEGSGTAPPPPGEREVSIRFFSQDLEPVAGEDERIRVRAVIGFQLPSGDAEAESRPVRLGIRYAFIEDDKAGERCPLEITAPSEFSRAEDDESTYVGRLGPEYARFSVLSAPYPADWSGRLVVTGALVPADKSTVEGEQ